MDARHRSITFRASRLKLLPQAIVLSAFTLPLSVLWVGCVFYLLRNQSIQLSVLVFAGMLTAALGFFAWAQFRAIHRLISPDLISVSISGIETAIGRDLHQHSWVMLGDPEIRLLNRKSSARSIMFPRHDGKHIIVRSEEYDHSPDIILAALKQARKGILVEPPRPLPPSSYIFLALPASCITLGIALAGLGAVIFH